MDESPSLLKKIVRPNVVVPVGVLSASQPSPFVTSGISICPCVSADGEHLKTALIFDKSFDLSPLEDHKPCSFLFVVVIYNIHYVYMYIYIYIYIYIYVG
jgi:hypothetical protein